MCGCTLPWLAVQCCPSPLFLWRCCQRAAFCLTFSLSFPSGSLSSTVEHPECCLPQCALVCHPHLSLTSTWSTLLIYYIPKTLAFSLLLEHAKLLPSWCLVFNTPPTGTVLLHIFHHLSCAQPPPQSNRPSPPQLTQSLSAHDNVIFFVCCKQPPEVILCVIYCLSFSSRIKLLEGIDFLSLCCLVAYKQEPRTVSDTLKVLQ